MPVASAQLPSQVLGQSQRLAPQLRQSLRLLAMNLPDLRQELFREMSTNPVIEDIEPTLETTTISERQQAAEAEAAVADYPDDYDISSEYVRDTTADTDALERRQRFFDNQTVEETLEHHLLSQLNAAGLDERDRRLADLLVGELDDRGYFAGSIPDLVMVSGETEDRIRKVLATIRELDPPGCGAITPQECLLAQLDKLDGSPYRETVRRLVTGHFADLAAGREREICEALRISSGDLAGARKALLTLAPYPGNAYRHTTKGVEYVNPEIHAVKCSDGYLAEVDARSLPEVRISEKYLKMLADPNVDAQTKAYIAERVAHAREIVEAVERRQDTITRIAQAIFDAQPDFFTQGLRGLRPLTMQEIADKVGVHNTTVSRTVNDKYVATPRGTIELRRFFGANVERDDVKERIRALIEAEDPVVPLSDERIAQILGREGYALARRTVAKYRDQLSIPGAKQRQRQRRLLNASAVPLKIPH